MPFKFWRPRGISQVKTTPIITEMGNRLVNKVFQSFTSLVISVGVDAIGGLYVFRLMRPPHFITSLLRMPRPTPKGGRRESVLYSCIPVKRPVASHRWAKPGFRGPYPWLFFEAKKRPTPLGGMGLSSASLARFCRRVRSIAWKGVGVPWSMLRELAYHWALAASRRRTSRCRSLFQSSKIRRSWPLIVRPSW